MTPNKPPAWRFLNTRFGNAFFNMAADEALVRAVTQGAPPAFRVYGWNPPAVSFGYAQHIAREIDPDACLQHNIGIVRRTTGGRAVLHHNELTYSVVCRTDDPLMGGSITEAYQKISHGLLAGLTGLGIKASVEARRRTQPSPRGKELTAPCFTSTALYEITAQNRKLIGSAQQRIGPVLLQHGSLLLGPEHKQIIDLLPPGKDPLRTRFKRELDRQTTSLSELLNRPVTFTETAQSLQTAISQTYPLTLIPTDLTPKEQAETDRLIKEKYSTNQWNYRH